MCHAKLADTTPSSRVCVCARACARAHVSGVYVSVCRRYLCLSRSLIPVPGPCICVCVFLFLLLWCLVPVSALCLRSLLVYVGWTTYQDVSFYQDNGWRDEFGSCNISPPRRMDLQILAVNDAPNFLAQSGNLVLQVMGPSTTFPSFKLGPNATLSKPSAVHDLSAVGHS